MQVHTFPDLIEWCFTAIPQHWMKRPAFLHLASSSRLQCPRAFPPWNVPYICSGRYSNYTELASLGFFIVHPVRCYRVVDARIVPFVLTRHSCMELAFAVYSKMFGGGGEGGRLTHDFILLFAGRMSAAISPMWIKHSTLVKFQWIGSLVSNCIVV